MPIYRISGDSIEPIDRTTFQEQGIRERQDLQTILKKNITIISPNTMVIAEEFGDWEDSRRRIDLLGIDRDANLIVIELKRTVDGGHMELQAIRYAAMISSLTFEQLVSIYTKYLDDNDIEGDAEELILEFLDWSEPDDDQFGQDVKIVLASAEFSKELTNSVMWLNEYRLDIRCVRMHPYVYNGETIIDIQTVIPIPEAADYQIRIREKKAKERESRNSSRDLTKYNISIAGTQHQALNKRWMMFHVISSALRNGCTPQQIMQALPWKGAQLFKVLDGELNAEQVWNILMEEDTGGRVPRAKRYFSQDGDFFHIDGKTYVLSNQWGNRSIEGAQSLAALFPNLEIHITPSE